MLRRWYQGFEVRRVIVRERRLDNKKQGKRALWMPAPELVIIHKLLQFLGSSVMLPYPRWNLPSPKKKDTHPQSMACAWEVSICLVAWVSTMPVPDVQILWSCPIWWNTERDGLDPWGRRQRSLFGWIFFLLDNRINTHSHQYVFFCQSSVPLQDIITPARSTPCWTWGQNILYNFFLPSVVPQILIDLFTTE